MSFILPLTSLSGVHSLFCSLTNHWVVPKYECLAGINYTLSCNLVTCVPKKAPAWQSV